MLNKIIINLNKIVMFVLVTMLLTFSGCLEEKNFTQIQESSPEEAITLPSRDENELEIKIVSFSSVYMRDNFDKKDRHVFTYNLSGRYYAIYNLSIKNDGSKSKTTNFKLNKLHLRIGNETFNTTTFESELYSSIEDTTLFPNQTLSGDVVFRVNSLYNKSFILMYDATPITSASFEKSLDALMKAENFDYSVALGIPPYSNFSERGGMEGSYEPNLDDYPYIWPNWMNRSIFEFFEKSDSENLLKSPPEDIPLTEIIYVLKVTTERNLTMLPVKTQFMYYHLFLVVDDAGNEMVNESRIQGIAILSNQTYKFQPWWALNIPQMNFSNATIVQISFQGFYGWGTAMRMPYVNQDIILDDKLNINVVRYYPIQMIS